MGTKKINAQLNKIDHIGRRLRLVDSIIEIARQDARKGDKNSSIEHTGLALNELAKARCEVEALSYSSDNDKSDWVNAVCFAFYGQINELERIIEAIRK